MPPNRFMFMRHRKLTTRLVRLAATLALGVAAGCGGTATAPTPTPTPGVAGRFVYASGVGASVINSYSLDTTSGKLSVVGQASPSGGARVLSALADSTGKFLLVSRVGGGIDVFAINRTTGALSLVNGSPFDRDHEAWSLTASSSNGFIWAAHNPELSIDTLQLDSSTGALTPQSSTGLKVSSTATPSTLRSDGRFLYFGTGVGINMASVDAATGRLTPGLLIPAPDTIRSVIVDPTGAFLYVTTATAFTSNTLFLYRITPSTGALLPFNGSVFAAGFDPTTANLRPDTVTFDPTGKFAYVFDRAARTGARSLGVSVFPVQASGLLGPSVLGPFSTPPIPPFLVGDPVSFTVDPSGRFGFIADASGSVSSFIVDPATGGLTAAGGPITTPAGTNIIVVTP